MGIFTNNSDIEQRRIERLGRNSRIRFLSDDGDAAGFTKLGEIDSHFDIIRKFNSERGAKEVRLVFDALAGFDSAAIMGKEIYVDFLPDRNVPDDYQRYAANTESSPTTRENRWHLILTAEFGNQTPIAP